MHTENEQNKKGVQVANNKALHCNMQLFENAEGEYYCVVDRSIIPTLIRGEYHPIGKNFHYPKKWGRKAAATVLVEHIIEDKKKIIQDAEIEIQKLERCLAEVQKWSDTDE